MPNPRGSQRPEGAFMPPVLSPATEDSRPGGKATTPPVVATLEPLSREDKEALNTRVPASTARRLKWFTKHYEYTVTNVVDVALQELFARHGVPNIDSNGEIVE